MANVGFQDEDVR